MDHEKLSRQLDELWERVNQDRTRCTSDDLQGLTRDFAEIEKQLVEEQIRLLHEGLSQQKERWNKYLMEREREIGGFRQKLRMTETRLEQWAGQGTPEGLEEPAPSPALETPPSAVGVEGFIRLLSGFRQQAMFQRITWKRRLADIIQNLEGNVGTPVLGALCQRLTVPLQSFMESLNGVRRAAEKFLENVGVRWQRTEGTADFPAIRNNLQDLVNDSLTLGHVAERLLRQVPALPAQKDAAVASLASWSEVGDSAWEQWRRAIDRVEADLVHLKADISEEKSTALAGSAAGERPTALGGSSEGDRPAGERLAASGRPTEPLPAISRPSPVHSVEDKRADAEMRQRLKDAQFENESLQARLKQAEDLLKQRGDDLAQVQRSASESQQDAQEYLRSAEESRRELQKLRLRQDELRRESDPLFRQWEEEKRRLSRELEEHRAALEEAEERQRVSERVWSAEKSRLIREARANDKVSENTLNDWKAQLAAAQAEHARQADDLRRQLSEEWQRLRREASSQRQAREATGSPAGTATPEVQRVIGEEQAAALEARQLRALDDLKSAWVAEREKFEKELEALRRGWQAEERDRRGMSEELSFERRRAEKTEVLAQESLRKAAEERTLFTRERESWELERRLLQEAQMKLTQERSAQAMVATDAEARRRDLENRLALLERERSLPAETAGARRALESEKPHASQVETELLAGFSVLRDDTHKLRQDLAKALDGLQKIATSGLEDRRRLEADLRGTQQRLQELEKNRTERNAEFLRDKEAEEARQVTAQRRDAELEAARAALDTVRNENKLLTAQWRSAVAEAEGQRAQPQDIRAEEDRLREKEEWRSSVEAARSELEKSREESRKLQALSSSLQQERDQLKNALVSAESAVENSRKNPAAAAEHWEKKNEALLNQNEGLLSQIKDLEQRCANYQAQVASLRQGLQETRSQPKNTWEQAPRVDVRSAPHEIEAEEVAAEPEFEPRRGIRGTALLMIAAVLAAGVFFGGPQAWDAVSAQLQQRRKARAEVHYNKGFEAMSKGEMGMAVTELGKALAEDPQHGGAKKLLVLSMWDLADQQIEEKNWKAARETLNELAKYMPGDPDVAEKLQALNQAEKQAS